MEVWMEAVTTVGFPIVISIYLLMRMERKLDTLSSALTRLDQTLSRWMEESRSA